jgi:hypothetical protein
VHVWIGTKRVEAFPHCFCVTVCGKTAINLRSLRELHQKTLTVRLQQQPTPEGGTLFLGLRALHLAPSWISGSRCESTQVSWLRDVLKGAATSRSATDLASHVLKHSFDSHMAPRYAGDVIRMILE